MTLEQIARRAFEVAFCVTILMDGAAHYLGSYVALVLFSIVLGLSAFVDVHRPALRRLKWGALGLAVFLVGLALWQVRWLPDTASAHPVWQNLAEQFGKSGGTLSVNRMGPVWEIPGLVLPFVAAAAAVPLYRTEVAARNLWTLLAIFGTSFAVYGFLQYFLFPNWHFLAERNDYLDSLSGFYVYRNAAASFLFMTALATTSALDRSLERIDMMAMWRHLRDRRPVGDEERRARLLAILLVVQVAAVLMTKSRAGFAILVVAFLPFLYLRLRRHLRAAAFPNLARLEKLGLGLAVAFVLFMGAQIIFRLEILGAEDAGRFCTYAQSLLLIRDNLAWGVGFGGFGEAFPPYRRAECDIFGVWDKAHDTYIQGFATMGWWFLPALVLPLALVLPPLLRARHLHGAAGTAALAALVALGAGAVHSLIDFPLEIPGNAILLGLLVVPAIAAASDPRRSKRHAALRRRRHSDAPPSGAAEAPARTGDAAR